MTARVCRIVYDEETNGYDNMVAKEQEMSVSEIQQETSHIKLQNLYVPFESIEFLQRNWTKQKGKEIVTGKTVFTDSVLGWISRYQRNNFVVTRLTINSQNNKANTRRNKY